MDTDSEENKTTADSLGRFLRKALPHSWFVSVRSFVVSFDTTVSMVNRDPMPKRWIQRYILRKRPTLHHFEVHITDHCNLKCKGCGHYSNISPEFFITQQEYEDDLRSLRAYCSHLEQLFILGGEPLLHPEVEWFPRMTREIFPETRIYLLTNGLLLKRMPESFWRSLRESGVILLCDNYPINLPREEITQLSETHGVSLEWTEYNDQFFLAPLDEEGKADPGHSFNSCQGYSNCPLLRHGKMYLCAPAGFSDIFREHFLLEGFTLEPEDSFTLSPDPTLAQSWQLIKFLSTPSPWCRHCDYTRFHRYAWGHSKGELEEWTQVQENPLPYRKVTQ